jgi:hypothetical protein
MLPAIQIVAHRPVNRRAEIIDFLHPAGFGYHPYSVSCLAS